MILTKSFGSRKYREDRRAISMANVFASLMA